MRRLIDVVFFASAEFVGICFRDPPSHTHQQVQAACRQALRSLPHVAAHRPDADGSCARLLIPLTSLDELSMHPLSEQHVYAETDTCRSLENDNLYKFLHALGNMRSDTVGNN